MVQSNPGQNAMAAAMDMVKMLANLPAPEKVYVEIKRFNDNMERIQPDLSKMAKILEGVHPADIRNLTTTLQGMKVSEMLLVLNDANSTIKQLYDRLWGKK